ncbi:MAG: hypothetical protein V4659_10960 [Pseudomonadota bacterium]
MAVLAGAALLIALTLVVGLAELAARRSPQTAIRINPFHSDALAAAAYQQLEQRAGAGADSAKDLALRAIALNPVSSSGIRTLGFVADLQREPRRGQIMLDHAQVLSRRDLPTQLALIQRAVDAEDVPGALRHYDIALKTSGAAHTVLMPILVQASADPGLVGPLAKLLAARPVWRIDFLRAAIQGSPEPARLAQLSVLLDRFKAPLTADQKVELADRLVQDRQFSAAAQLMDRARDPALVTTGSVGPFGWKLATGYGWGAERAGGKGPGANTILLHTTADYSGEVARQLVVLRPGPYRIAVRGHHMPSLATESPFVAIGCAIDGAQNLVSLDLVATARPATEWSGHFVVPARCGGQWLTINLRPQRSDQPTDTAIETIAIVRAA